MLSIIIPNIPEMLQSAPIGSPEFRTAIDAFLVKLEEATSGPPRLFRFVMAEYFMALRRRFRGGQDLDELARRIGSCRIIALFAGSIRIDEKSCAEGPMAAINRFAAEHIPTCEHCSAHYETDSRLRRLVSAATSPDEN
jgi:hypothetical protein